MLKTLTSFRFFAALMVYLFHSVELFNQYNFGAVGVSFFFVLSGFIMAYTYNSKFTHLNRDNIKNFYIARFAKIYPVHLLTLLISIPYMIIWYLVLHHYVPSMEEFIMSLLANLFLVHSFIPLPFGSTPYMFNMVSWSLSTESFFYLIFPLVIFAALKYFFKKSNVTNFIITLSFYVAILLITFISFQVRGVKTDDWYFYVFPVFRSMDFVTGILVGLMFISFNKQHVNLSKKMFSIFELASIGAFFGWTLLSPIVPMEFKFSVYYIPMWCFLIFIFAFQKGFLSKIISNKLFVFLGEISFSFYMVHLLIINYVGLLKLPSFYGHIITFFGSVIVSTLIYKFYEEPLRKRIRNGAIKKNKKESTVEISA